MTPEYFIKINHELYYPVWVEENGRQILDLKPVCCPSCAHYVCMRLNTSAFTDLSKKCGEFTLSEIKESA